MKEMKKFILLSMAVAVMLTSCNKDDKITNPQEEVLFTSNIVNVTLARQAGNIWKDNAAIGIYMLKELSLDVVESISNVKYTTAEGGATGTFAADTKVIFFPDNNDKVRFMSYYPYDKDLENGTYKINVAKQTDLDSIDLRYSFNTASTYSKTVSSKTVPLTFDHQLSQIVVNVKAGEGLTNTQLSNLLVSLSGFSRKADFNLFSGAISNLSDEGTISLSATTTEEGFAASYKAIVIPTADISNAKMVFDLNNGDADEGVNSDRFTWSFNQALVKGTKYVYNVTINRSGITIEATINDWGNGGNHNIIAE